MLTNWEVLLNRREDGLFAMGLAKTFGDSCQPKWITEGPSLA